MMEKSTWYINCNGDVGLARQGRNPDVLAINLIVEIGGPGGPLESWDRMQIRKASEAEIRFRLQQMFPHPRNIEKVKA